METFVPNECLLNVSVYISGQGQRNLVDKTLQMNANIKVRLHYAHSVTSARNRLSVCVSHDKFNQFFL